MAMAVWVACMCRGGGRLAAEAMAHAAQAQVLALRADKQALEERNAEIAKEAAKEGKSLAEAQVRKDGGCGAAASQRLSMLIPPPVLSPVPNFPGAPSHQSRA